MAEDVRGTGTTTGRKILTATAIAGTLDIAMAAIDTAAAGRPIADMLRAVASGPVPAAGGWGAGGAALGLVVHFVIMAAMAAVYFLAARRIAWVRARPLATGAAYGVALWLVMYGIVLPQRFGAPFPSADPVEIAKQLFAHIVLVGLVFGVVARRR